MKKQYRPGIIVITFKAGMRRKAIENSLGKKGAKVEKWLGARTAVVKVPAGRESYWIKAAATIVGGVVCATLDELL